MKTIPFRARTATASLADSKRPRRRSVPVLSSRLLRVASTASVVCRLAAAPVPPPRSAASPNADAGQRFQFANPGFEDGVAGWRIPKGSTYAAVSTEQAATGRHSLEIADDSPKDGSNVTSSRVPVPGEGFYRLRCKFYGVSGNGLGIYSRLFDKNGAPLKGGTHLLGLGGAGRKWERVEISFMLPAPVRFFQLWIHSYSAARVTGFLDDFELEAVALRNDGTTERSRKDLEVIETRLTESALGSGGSFKDVRGYLERQASNGSWKDIDYLNRNRSAWAPTRHVSRVYRMAQAWRHPRSPLHGDPVLRQGILRAWDFWTHKNLKCPNWWYNVIGVPRIIYRTLLLIGSELSREQFKAGIEILKNAKLGMTGENLVWVAEVTIARGCLENDPWTTQLAFGRIEDEIRIGSREGIQPDFSFYQHGTQLYNGGYGRGFSRDCAYFAALARGTCFEFAQSKLDILAAYLLDGQQWMIRGATFDYSACGRELVRKSGGKASSLTDACRLMLELDPALVSRRSELEGFRGRLLHPGPERALQGNTHFRCADYMTHHRAAFMASVRMTSPRTLQTETCNDENLFGKHLSDGLMYLYRRGDEYRGIFPVWDWKRLPGTTVELDGRPPTTRNGQRGERSFVGGVSDGRYGLAAMDFVRDKLTARKAWFFFDREIVCLGAGITCPTDHQVVTSVNQCRLKGVVTASAGHTVPARLEQGQHAWTGPGWVWHDKVGYIFPKAADIVIRNSEQSGNWWRINHVYPKTDVSMGVFSLWIRHGVRVRDAAYRYVVVPGISEDALRRYARQLPVSVAANTPVLQAVRHAESAVLGIAFYAAGGLKTDDGMRIEVDKPCLVLVRPTESGFLVAVSNPENKPLDLVMKLNRPLEGDDCTRVAAEGVTSIRFALPGGALAGSSVVKRLTSSPL